MARGLGEPYRVLLKASSLWSLVGWKERHLIKEHQIGDSVFIGLNVILAVVIAVAMIFLFTPFQREDKKAFLFMGDTRE